MRKRYGKGRKVRRMVRVRRVIRRRGGRRLRRPNARSAPRVGFRL